MLYDLLTDLIFNKPMGNKPFTKEQLKIKKQALNDSVDFITDDILEKNLGEKIAIRTGCAPEGEYSGLSILIGTLKKNDELGFYLDVEFPNYTHLDKTIQKISTDYDNYNYPDKFFIINN